MGTRFYSDIGLGKIQLTIVQTNIQTGRAFIGSLCGIVVQDEKTQLYEKIHMHPLCIIKYGTGLQQKRKDAKLTYMVGCV